MNKFPRDVKWNILSCCTQKQGATALHIAVAERSVKAVILLLDAAEERRDDLLNLTDRNKKSAVDYTSEFSLLGKYLRLSSTDINPGTAVYKAVVADDLMMVQFIYEHSMKPFAIDFIKNNANGRNLIQEACKSNSLNVLKYFITLLTESERLKCLLEVSAEGDTAMHTCAVYNRPAALHLILKSVCRQNRLLLFPSKNQRGETVTDVGLPHQGVLDTLDLVYIYKLNFYIRPIYITYAIFIIDHKWICDQNLLDIFTKYEHSLFNIQLTNERLQQMYRVIEKNRVPCELGYVRNVNYDAAKCLMFGDLQQAQTLIGQALETSPLSVHALCNMGVYLLKMQIPDYSEAELVALQLLELLSQANGKVKLTAKIDFAYWYSESLQTDAARQHSSEIFEQCLDDCKKCDDGVLMNEYCSYFYVKILVRTLKHANLRSIPMDYVEETIRRVTRHLKVLAKGDVDYIMVKC
ncbi:hypothetical protein EB796_024151 [Bugula neritina]|uniref:Uncharacterized protein n=1 Tax=Bugula neritina TaxID=10212 RepID=A0A7J7IVG6_BUGNE|nr:hypothetical protein EB796_024151 [Bugula neritina]